MDSPLTPRLSPSQLAAFAAVGEERPAAVGDVLFDVDDPNPLIVILEGEAAVLDPAGQEILRVPAQAFIGEMNLLTGQPAYLRAVATQPMRYLAVERDAVRGLLTDDGPLSDLVLSTFIARREELQRREGVGVEVIGPRSSEPTRELVEYLRRARLPHTWHDPDHDAAARATVAGVAEAELPIVRLPGGAELRAPSNGVVSRALGIGRELGPRVEVDLAIVGAGPAGLGA